MPRYTVRLKNETWTKLTALAVEEHQTLSEALGRAIHRCAAPNPDGKDGMHETLLTLSDATIQTLRYLESESGLSRSQIMTVAIESRVRQIIEEPESVLGWKIAVPPRQPYVDSVNYKSKKKKDNS